MRQDYEHRDYGDRDRRGVAVGERMNDDAFEWDDAPLWRGMVDDGLLRKAVLLRRAPAGGTAPPTTPKAHAGGQFIPASDWLREKQIAKDALPGIIDTFGTQMQYLRMVWQATAELGDNVPKSMPTAGQTRWMMKTVIRDTYENAFTQGKRAAGNLFAVTEADRKAIKKTRRDEFTYLEKFMRDMETGGGKMDYAQRMDYYAKAARELFWVGFVRGDLSSTRTIQWHLGPTASDEHCATCVGVAQRGPIPADVFWNEYASKGILPQSGALDCIGYHCPCRLTDDRPETAALERGRLRRRSA